MVSTRPTHSVTLLHPEVAPYLSGPTLFLAWPLFQANSFSSLFVFYLSTCQMLTGITDTFTAAFACPLYQPVTPAFPLFVVFPQVISTLLPIERKQRTTLFT